MSQNFIQGVENNTAAVGGAENRVTVTNASTKTKLDVSATFPAGTFPGLINFVWDYVLLGYTGTNLTSAVFKTGGSGGTTVATLALTYDGSNNLLTVTKT